MREKSDNVFYNIDWIIVLIFLILVTFGYMNVYSAVYVEGKSNIFDLSHEESKQLIFGIISIGLAFSILIIDASFFTATAFILYGGILFLNIIVRFLGSDIHGSHSWFKFGGLSLQPAEFAKWATMLALAKYMSGVSGGDWKVRFLYPMCIILAPVAIMVGLQNETGCALVFAGFILVMYREGLIPGYLILFGLTFAAMFIIGIKYPGARYVQDASTLKFHFTVIPKAIIILVGCLAAIGVGRLLFIRRTILQITLTAMLVVIFTGTYLAAPIVLEKMPNHMNGRIKCWLGLPVSREMHDKYAYNTEQAMIAIGSGGMWGKGYLQGTLTKYRFVPEQETDFIFCTVGEEWGWVGTTGVVVLYLILISRLLRMAERQRSDFTRIYGYGVAAVFFIHLVVNVGMTIGLIPVIGIPLPFFSYGGSSLISFTILLFIFVKLDSQRLLVLR
ncbi:MAG TPA: rod shape-determining protein RodA [Bacteroidia bacterium]|jgi:rod shape determining protein RodA|nr:rod shape-determining protein RodA [Bacteroidia bacterium]